MVLTGLVMVLMGLLRLGAAMSFVSNAVMTGFSVGIALQIVTGSIGDATGYDSDVHNKLGQLVDAVLNVGSWAGTTVAVAASTIVVWAACQFVPRLRPVAILVAMLVMTAVVTVVNIDVELVEDIADVPTGLPGPVLPDLSVAPDLIGGAVAVALVALAQAASISAAVPNPDGSRSSMNGDFVAQGLGNVAGGFFQTLPAGGSMSRTGIAVEAGAKTRWAGVFAGVWLAVIVLTVGRYAGLIPMAVIGGLVIVIGAELIWERRADIVMVLRTSALSATAMVVTFLATTQIPLQNAIVVGAVLSLLLYCFQAAKQASLTALVRDSDGGWLTAQPPERIEPRTVTVLDYSGVAFFAEVYRIAEQWPNMDDATGSAVVLRVRGLPDIPSSEMRMTLERYNRKLDGQGSRLFIAGAHPQLVKRMHKADLAGEFANGRVFEEKARFFGALERAYAAAQEWVEHRQGGDADVR